MNIAEEFANYLEANGFGTVGTNIFVDFIPDSTNGIYVSHLGGALGLYTPMNEAIIDVTVKDTSASDALATINSIKNFIHRMHTTEINSAYIFSMLVLDEPESLGRDMEHASQYKITVSVINRDTSVIS